MGFTTGEQSKTGKQTNVRLIRPEEKEKYDEVCRRLQMILKATWAILQICLHRPAKKPSTGLANMHDLSAFKYKEKPRLNNENQFIETINCLEENKQKIDVT
jgi:hypothetical protein